MFNDLISRAAVLEMIEDLVTINAKTKFHVGIKCVCKSDLVRNINEIPTAYDVDKVVELEKENAEMKEVIRKLLCSEYGSSCQFCIQDNNDNAMCRNVGGSGSWCCENAAYDREWNKR